MSEQSQQIETPSQAVNVLLQGVQLAQKRGADNLEEASILSSAVSYLTVTSPEAAPAEVAEESSGKKNKE